MTVPFWYGIKGGLNIEDVLERSVIGLKSVVFLKQSGVQNRSIQHQGDQAISCIKNNEHEPFRLYATSSTVPDQW